MYTLVLLPHRGSYPYSTRARLSRCGRERELSVGRGGGQRRLRNWARLGSVGCGEIPQLAKRTRDFFCPPLKPSDAPLITKTLGSAFIVHTQKRIKGMEISWGKGTFLQICMSLSRLELGAWSFFFIVSFALRSLPPSLWQNQHLYQERQLHQEMGQRASPT